MDQRMKGDGRMDQKGGMKQIQCGPECGFMVRSHDEKEVLGITQRHAKEQHGKSVTNDQLRSMMTTA